MIFIIAPVLTLVTLFIINKAFRYNDFETANFICITICTCVLLVSLASCAFGQIYGRAEVNRYHIMSQSIEKSREVGLSELERAGLQSRIIEYNKYLAGVKYYNDGVFDIFYYDGLAELDYLE